MNISPKVSLFWLKASLDFVSGIPTLANVDRSILSPWTVLVLLVLARTMDSRAMVELAAGYRQQQMMTSPFSFNPTSLYF